MLIFKILCLVVKCLLRSAQVVILNVSTLNLLLKLFYSNLIEFIILISILLKMTNEIKHKVLLFNDIITTRSTTTQKLSDIQKESNCKYQNKMKKIYSNSNLSKIITSSNDLSTNSMTRIRRVRLKEKIIFVNKENSKNFNFRLPLQLKEITYYPSSLLLKSYLLFIIIAVTTANTSFGSHYSNKPSIESDSNAVQCKYSTFFILFHKILKFKCS